jgi:hypothetical protein
MIQNIVDYIESGRKAGKTDEAIERDLSLLGGWTPDDVAKAKRTLRLRKIGLWIRPSFKRALIHGAYVALIVPPLFSAPLLIQFVLGPNGFSDTFSWVWTIPDGGSLMGQAIAVALSLPYWAMLVREYIRFIRDGVGAPARKSYVRALFIYPNLAFLFCYALIAFLLWSLGYIATFL